MALLTALVVTLGAMAAGPDAALCAGDDGAAHPEARAKIAQYMQAESVFIENAGQWAAPEIRFAMDSHGANVGLTEHGPRFQLFRAKPEVAPAEQSGDGSVPDLSAVVEAHDAEIGDSPVPA